MHRRPSYARLRTMALILVKGFSDLEKFLRCKAALCQGKTVCFKFFSASHCVGSNAPGPITVAVALVSVPSEKCSVKSRISPFFTARVSAMSMMW